MKSTPQNKLLQAIWDDGRYPPEAYEFLHHGLEHATSKAFGGSAPDEPRHVSGQQLCEGLRELALERWGLLARTVLGQWNIHRTRDFGEMVFFLIEQGLMGRQESDVIEDFDSVYDFDQAFGGYGIAMEDEEG